MELLGAPSQSLREVFQPAALQAVYLVGLPHMPLLLSGACTALWVASPSRCDCPCAAPARPLWRLPMLQVGLSLLAHLMAFTPKSGQPAQGELFEVR